MGKKCFKCGKILSLDKFYSHSRMKDGHLNKCIDCAKKDSVNARNSRIEHYREYDRERYKKDANRKKNGTITTKIFREKNPSKYEAQNKVNNAIRDGRLIKQPCIICGNKKSHGHHEDYSKPLEVLWLCAEHHSMIHHHRNIFFELYSKI
jgi:hypothetical protein